MKKSKRILSALLALIMLVGMLPIVSISVSAAEPSEGMSFNTDDMYAMPEIVKPTGSVTFEAEVWIPYNTKDNTRSGVILGNYNDAEGITGDYSIEIHQEGVIRLYIRGCDIKFTSSTSVVGSTTAEKEAAVDARKYMGTSSAPTFAKIAIVADTAAHKATLYINGTKIAEKSNAKLTDGIFGSSIAPLCVGGDWRNGNSQNFKGKIKNVTMYSDIRTEAEIKASADATSYAVDKTDTALNCAYDLTSKNKLADLSANEYHLVFSSPYGMTFSNSDPKIYLNNKLTEFPLTMEFEFYAPYLTATRNGSRPGVLLGNWNNYNSSGKKQQQPTFMVELHNDGMPKLCMGNSAGVATTDIKFDEIDARTGGWVHMVIVKDGYDYRCYIDGVLVQTVTDSKNFEPDIEAMQSVNRISLGKDARSTPMFFDGGIIRNVALYDEPLTAAQIKSSYENGVDINNESLMLYYDLENSRGKFEVRDLSGNGNHASPDYYAREEAQKDYAYSFAVIGDTQKQVWKDFTTATDSTTGNETYLTKNIYKWLVDNKDEKKIEWVFGVGDITENNGIRNDATMLEWDIAKEAITQLDAAGMDYSVILGNHDIITVSGEGGSAYFNQYFGSASGDFYTKRVTGYYEEGKLDNYYMNFEVGETKYMMLALEYGANDKILKWAGEVVDAHPERQVIVTTHAYMFRDNTTLDKGDVVPPNSTGVTTSDTSRNNGDMMWEKFVSQHRNILMVLSGHDPYSNIAFRQDKGVHGNTVSQFLVDPQGMDVTLGMVCMLYFSEDGRQVSVEWISTGKTQAAQATDPEAEDILHKAINQFDFTMIDNVGNGIHSTAFVADESDDTKSVYRIFFTNGTYSEYVVYHGKDGAAGAPGASGVTPMIQINATTNEWEVSYDNGATYTSLGVKATGEKGDKGDTGAAGASITVTGVELTGQDGLVDTYTITFSDNSTAIFTVTNGADGEDGEDATDGETVTVSSVELTGSEGLKDTYTITFSDGTTTDFTVTNGADGEDGKTPYVGDNGNWFLGDTDTGVLARGVDGHIPYVGINGNWWVGGVDTEVPAQGEKGEPGATGATGAAGATGATGATGEKGEKGDKGETGDVGATGATGPKGADGTTTVMVAVSVAAGVCGLGSIGMAVACVLFVTKKRVI